MNLKKILKANPYHDRLGRFANANDRGSHHFVSIGGIFGKQNQKDKESSGSSTASSANPAAVSESLGHFVELEGVLSRAKERLEVIESQVSDFKAPKDLNNPYPSVSKKGMQEAFSSEKVSVYMAIKPSNLKKILGGDEFKNSLQTGKGTFKTIGEARAIKEKPMLGIKANTDTPEGFPKYGFVASKGKMDYENIVGFGYGNSYVEFHDSVRKNTTVTLGDSYNNNSGAGVRIPAHIDNVGPTQLIAGSISNSGDIDKNASTAKTYKDFNKVIRGEYVEAQIYGNLDASHIKAIHIESKKDAKALEGAIKKKGLSIEIKPSEHHTFLKQVWEGELEAQGKLSLEDFKKLGDPYIDRMWNSGSMGANLWAWEKTQAVRN